MKEVHFLDREQMRLIAHPLRQRVLQILCREELSTSQLSERLQDAPSNLYYHIDRLRASGLIELIRTEPVRGTVEKFYRAVADCFTVHPDLLRITGDAPDSGELLATVETMAEGALSRFAASLGRGLVGTGEGRSTPVVNSLTVRTTPIRMQMLEDQLVACIRAFHAEEAPEADETVEFVLFELLFPVDLPAPRGRGDAHSADE